MNKKTFMATVITLAFLVFPVAGLQAAKFAECNPVFARFPLNIYFVSPLNTTYNTSSIVLNAHFEEVDDCNDTLRYAWYSLDGQANIPLPLVYEGTSSHNGNALLHSEVSGVTDLPPLPDGTHTITVFGEYIFNQNILGTLTQKSNVTTTFAMMTKPSPLPTPSPSPTPIAPLHYEGPSDAIGPPVILYTDESSNIITDEIGPPIIKAENGHFNLMLDIRIPESVYSPSAQDTMMTLWVFLTSVSYKASWQNNQTIELLNFPYNFPEYSTGPPSNAQAELYYTLANVTYGNQHIEVTAACDGYIWNGSNTYHSFSGNASKTLSFTVAPPTSTTTLKPKPSPSPSPNLSPSNSQSSLPTEPPTEEPKLEPTPTPNNAQENPTSLLIIAALVVVAIVVGILIYFRKRS